MELITSHGVRMGDAETNSKKLGPLAEKRSPHLVRLEALEEIIHELAPLPASYDVGRFQPPYFNEFTYTEMMGGLIVAPQSCEAYARVVQVAADRGDESDFDPVPAILKRDHMDKYQLETPTGALPKRVALLPGSNIFGAAVCREALTRQMHEDPDLVIKLHPLTNEGTVRDLGRLFGYHRLVPALQSGWAYLDAAAEVVTTSTSEMGLYAILLDKPVANVTKFAFEARASYGPWYRHLWGRDPATAKASLRHLLRSPYSGFLHPDDPDVRERAKAFFGAAMEVREPFKPLVAEYNPIDYGRMVVGAFDRKSKPAPAAAAEEAPVIVEAPAAEAPAAEEPAKAE